MCISRFLSFIAEVRALKRWPRLAVTALVVDVGLGGCSGGGTGSTSSANRNPVSGAWGRLTSGAIDSSSAAATELAALVNEPQTNLDPNATTSCSPDQSSVAGTYECQTQVSGTMVPSTWRIDARGVIFTQDGPVKTSGPSVGTCVTAWNSGSSSGQRASLAVPAEQQSPDVSLATYRGPTVSVGQVGSTGNVSVIAGRCLLIAGDEVFVEQQDRSWLASGAVLTQDFSAIAVDPTWSQDNANAEVSISPQGITPQVGYLSAASTGNLVTLSEQDVNGAPLSTSRNTVQAGGILHPGQHCAPGTVAGQLGQSTVCAARSSSSATGEPPPCNSSHSAYFRCATAAAPYCGQGQCSYPLPTSGSCAPGYRRTLVQSTGICEKISSTGSGASSGGASAGSQQSSSAAFTPGDQDPHDASASTCDKGMEIGPDSDCSVGLRVAQDFASGKWPAPGSDTVTEGGQSLTFDCSEVGIDKSQVSQPGIYRCVSTDPKDWFEFTFT